MSAPFAPNQSIHDQHLSTAVKAVLLVPGGSAMYGYAALTGTRDQPEIEVNTFRDRESMLLALSALRRGRLLGDIYPDVYRFGPDEPLRLRLVIEADGEDDQ